MASKRFTTVKAGIILGSALSILSAENLIINPSFEKGTDGWSVWGAVETKQSYAGAKAVTVTNSSAAWSGISQEIPLLKDAASFTITGWMKTDSVVQGEESWEQALISVEFLDENGEPFNYYPGAVAMETGSTEWTLYEMSYTVYPVTKAIRVIAALGNATGTASYDQLTLVQKKEDGTILGSEAVQQYARDRYKEVSGSKSFVKNGSFDSGNEHWKAYNAAFPTEGRDGSGVMKISNKMVQWGGATQEIAIPSEATSVSVSGWIKTDSVIRGNESWNKALINIEFNDSTGTMVGDYVAPAASVAGTEAWAFYEKRYPITEGSSQVKLLCQLSDAKGTALFDDVAVIFYDAAGRVIQ